MASLPKQGPASATSDTSFSNDGMSSRATSISRYESASSSPTRSGGWTYSGSASQWRARNGSFGTTQGNVANNLSASQYATPQSQGQHATQHLGPRPMHPSMSSLGQSSGCAGGNVQSWNNMTQSTMPNPQQGLSTSTVPIFNPFGASGRAHVSTGPYASSRLMSGPATPSNTPASPISPYPRPSVVPGNHAHQQHGSPAKPVDPGLTNWNERQASQLLGNLTRPCQQQVSSPFGIIGQASDSQAVPGPAVRDPSTASSFRLEGSFEQGLQQSKYATPVPYGQGSLSPMPAYPSSPQVASQQMSPNMTGQQAYGQVVPLTANAQPAARPALNMPNPTGKEYCTFYLRTGQCDYSQQNCQFKHHFPSTWHEMKRIGFLQIPDWIKNVDPETYKQIHDMLGEPPWGSYSGSRATKGRADIDRQYRLDYGRNNQHADPAEMARGRRDGGRNHPHAQHRGLPATQQRSKGKPAPSRMLDQDISPPASPSRQLPATLGYASGDAADDEDDDDAVSVAESTASSNLIGLDSAAASRQNSRRRSVGRGSVDLAGRQDIRLASVEEHPVLFKDSEEARDKSRIRELERKNDEMRLALARVTPLPGRDSGYGSTSQNTSGSETSKASPAKARAPLTGADRFKREMEAAKKANDKSQPSSSKVQHVVGRASESEGGTSSSHRRGNAHGKARRGQAGHGHQQHSGGDRRLQRLAALDQAEAALKQRTAAVRRQEAELAAALKAVKEHAAAGATAAPAAASAEKTSPTAGKGKGKGRADGKTVSFHAAVSQKLTEQTAGSELASGKQSAAGAKAPATAIAVRELKPSAAGVSSVASVAAAPTSAADRKKAAGDVALPAAVATAATTVPVTAVTSASAAPAEGKKTPTEGAKPSAT